MSIAEDQKIIRDKKDVKTIANRRLKLEDALKQGYRMILHQCLQEVKDKLKVSNDWEQVQCNQSLHKLIQRVERICIGFNDHKQEVFNLVQALKTLFLCNQREKEGVETFAASGTQSRHLGGCQGSTRVWWM